MKLYSFVPQDCSGKVRWLLLELGVPFEDTRMNFKAGETKTPEYLAKHPLGQVPVLEDGDISIFESFAIVAYLADKFSDKGLAPSANDFAKRAEYYQWMFFTANSAENYFNKYQKLSKMTDEYRTQWEDHIRQKLQMVLGTIESQLGKTKKADGYLLGTFSAVDTCMGYALDSIREEPFFNDYPNIRDYYAKLAKRDACVKSEIFKVTT